MSVPQLPSNLRWPFWLAPGLVVTIAAAQAFANPWWILEPSRFAPIDDSYVYLSFLFRAFDGLSTVRSPADLWQILETISVGGRPPSKQLLTLPLLAVFGRSEPAALAVNLGYGLLLVFATCSLARHFAGRGIAVLAALVAATLPPIVWLSRMYVPYHTVPATVALVCWRCVELLRERRAANVWWVGAAAAFAILHHPHATWFIALPVALAVVWSWLGGAGPGPWKARAARLFGGAYLWRGVVPAAAVCGTLVLGWYLTIGYPLLRKLLLLSDLESFRGVKVLARGFHGIEASFWWYLRTAPAAVTNVFTVAALVGVGLWLWRGPGYKRWLAITAICGYVGASLQNNLTWFVMAGMLPIVAVAAVAWMDRLPRWWRAAAVAVTLVVGLTNYAVASFDLGKVGKVIVRSLSYPVETRRQSFLAQVDEDQRMAELEVLSRTTAALGQDPRCREKCTLLVSRTRAIGYARLGFYLVANRPELDIRVVNEGAREWGTQYKLASLVGADYLLYPDAPQTSSLYHRATVAFLQRPGVFASSHQRLFTIDAPPAPRMTLARRLRDLTSAELELAFRELPIDELYKRQRFELLAKALIAERDYRGAEDQLRLGLEELGPSPVRAYQGRQIVAGYLDTGDFERAAAATALLAEKFPRDPKIRRLVARVRRQAREAQL